MSDDYLRLSTEELMTRTQKSEDNKRDTNTSHEHAEHFDCDSCVSFTSGIRGRCARGHSHGVESLDQCTPYTFKESNEEDMESYKVIAHNSCKPNENSSKN